MLFALFALWSLPFWLVLIAAAIVLTVAVENEKSFISILTLAGTLAFLQFVSGVPVIHFIFSHPTAIALYALLFLAVGVGWAVAKWYFYLRKTLARYKETKAEYLESRGAQTEHDLTDSDKQSLKYRVAGLFNPEVSDHKSDIIFWMSYWPFSMLGTLLNDFVRKIYNHLYTELSGLLQRMSDNMFAAHKIQ